MRSLPDTRIDPMHYHRIEPAMEGYALYEYRIGGQNWAVLQCVPYGRLNLDSYAVRTVSAAKIGRLCYEVRIVCVPYHV